MGSIRTITSILRDRATVNPEERAFTFVQGADGQEAYLSFGQLDRAARAVAAQLRGLGIGLAEGAARSRSAATSSNTVLVVFPAGLDFLAGFFGCLYAGAIAVPCRYPHPRRPLTHIAGLAADSGATVGLTTREMQPILAEALGTTRWLVPDATIDRDDFPDQVGDPDGIAYLQYTSGSTAAPKGVIVRHRHIAANCGDVARQFALGPASRICSWLPHFHDLGLVYGCIEPLYVGCPTVLMSPMTFARQPLRWLELISRYRITHTAAPSFAYQACLDIPAAQLQQLDLHSWQVALNGAEPIRADAVEEFTRRFAAHGFAATAMCPAYGLAENTLLASACGPDRTFVTRTVRTDRLADGEFTPATGGVNTTRFVGCGTTADLDTRIAIVDPQSSLQCSPGRIGEIWLRGPSVTDGYWRKPEASQSKFAARLADTGEGPFLRTGDLGILEDEELFVLGRLDDLIIIRGANYSAEELELAVEASDPALQAGGGAAFRLDLHGEPRLVIAHEVTRRALRDLEPDRVVRSIVRTISERYELEVSAVLLLRPRGLPKTHTGKKQRRVCRREFLAGALHPAHTWMTPQLSEALSARSIEAVEIAPAAASSGEGATHRSPAMMSANNDASPAVQARDAADNPGNAEDLIAWLRTYAGERINSRLMDERRSIPPYMVLDFGNHGVLGLQAPRQYGGLELGNRAFARVLEQLAAIDLTLATFVTGHNALGIRPIMRHATAAKRAELLPVLAAGRELGAFAMTEPDAGSNVRGIAARGQWDGSGGWHLWGTKIWSGSAAWAGVINTFVRIDGGRPDAPRGITGFVLRQGTPGLRMGPEALTTGLRAMVQNEVRLEGIRVSPADLLGDVGDGMVAAMDTMEFGRFCVAAISLGVIKRSLQLIVRHAARRSIATGRLLANPVTLMRISELTAASTAIEALIALVGARLDRQASIPSEIYGVCKVAGPEFAWRAADDLVQQLGGRGYIETNLAPQILRDARVLRIFEGPTEPIKAYIGSRLVHTPEELHAFLTDELRQPTLAAEIQVAAARIAERCHGAARRFPDSPAAEQWSYALAGEVAIFGILLAAVRSASQVAASTQLRRAEEWARLQFDRRLADALEPGPAEAVLLDAANAEQYVAGYVAAIGDLEQTMPGEQQGRDRLLDRDAAAASIPTESIAPAARTDDGQGPAPEALSNGGDEADTGPSREIAAWLIGWVAEALQRDRAEIRVSDRFSEFGMDSVKALMLINSFEELWGVALPRTAVWDYPTIGELTGYLASLAAAATAAPGPAAASVGASNDANGSSNASRVEPFPDDIAILAQVDRLSPEEIKSLLSQFPHGE